MKCAECGGGCFRARCLPQFQEDRLRMYDDGKGGRYSYALGRDMPESRAERRALEKAGNFAFCSFGEKVSPEHEAANEYHKAKQSGATHQEAEKHAPWPKPKPRKLSHYVDKWAKKKTDWSDIRLRDD